MIEGAELRAPARAVDAPARRHHLIASTIRTLLAATPGKMMRRAEVREAVSRALAEPSAKGLWGEVDAAARELGAVSTGRGNSAAYTMGAR